MTRMLRLQKKDDENFIGIITFEDLKDRYVIPEFHNEQFIMMTNIEIAESQIPTNLQPCVQINENGTIDILCEYQRKASTPRELKRYDEIRDYLIKKQEKSWPTSISLAWRECSRELWELLQSVSKGGYIDIPLPEILQTPDGGSRLRGTTLAFNSGSMRFEPSDFMISFDLMIHNPVNSLTEMKLKEIDTFLTINTNMRKVPTKHAKALQALIATCNQETQGMSATDFHQSVIAASMSECLSNPDNILYGLLEPVNVDNTRMDEYRKHLIGEPTFRDGVSKITSSLNGGKKWQSVYADWYREYRTSGNVTKASMEISKYLSAFWSAWKELVGEDVWVEKEKYGFMRSGGFPCLLHVFADLISVDVQSGINTKRWQNKDTIKEQFRPVSEPIEWLVTPDNRGRYSVTFAGASTKRLRYKLHEDMGLRILPPLTPLTPDDDIVE